MANLDDPPASESEPSAEEQAAWQELSERLRAQPVAVQTVEIEASAAADNFEVRPWPT